MYLLFQSVYSHTIYALWSDRNQANPVLGGNSLGKKSIYYIMGVGMELYGHIDKLSCVRVDVHMYLTSSMVHCHPLSLVLWFNFL